MIRDNRKQIEYFNQWIAFDFQRIEKVGGIRKQPAFDANYEPQYVYELAGTHLHLLLRRYSRGDPILELRPHLLRHIEVWHEAEQLGASIWTPEVQHSRHAWAVNQNYYIRSFWLIGLALTMELEESAWRQLLALIGNEGQDALLDRVIATRQPARRIGASLCFPKQYERLLEVVLAPIDQQAPMLRDYVNGWYASFDEPPKSGLSRMTNSHERPYWYDFETGEGAYFGFWCLEAVGVVKAFGMDDSLCLGLTNYPGDFLRPNGPTTHKPGAVPILPGSAGHESISQKVPSLFSRMRKVMPTQK
jgi:Domain of unknown function (DUF1911)/Domain of unknown function (DUF1910)